MFLQFHHMQQFQLTYNELLLHVRHDFSDVPFVELFQ